MKGKDNGIFDHQIEHSKNGVSPKETDEKFNVTDKIISKGDIISNKKEEDQNIKTEEEIEKGIKQEDDIDMLNDKNKVKNNKEMKLSVIENNKEIKVGKKLKNGINKIDLEKNVIILNKKNLKEINAINKEINKKNQTLLKKGEVVNIFGNNKFYYTNKDINNTINKSYDIYTTKLENPNENSGKIMFNMKFPNEVIEKFYERKKNKKKENKDNNIYMNSFGSNPLERLKEIQEKLNDAPPTTKSSKTSIRQFKVNQKKLKEEDCKIQNYIKLFPVFNCPEHKIFKITQFYYYNRIYEDKNNYYNKKRKNSGSKNKMKEEVEKEKDENEEDTLDLHIKKKFINKKRNKSKNKENKNDCEA